MATEQELLERIAELEEIVGLTAAMPLIATLRWRGLTRNPARLLGMLLRRPIVPHSCAHDALYGDVKDAREITAIPTVLKNLRKVLRPMGVEIINMYGEGWMITPDDKRKIYASWPETWKAA